MTPSEEIRHLESGALEGELPRGIGLDQLLVRCDGNAAEVVSKCREVLLIVVRTSTAKWPAPDEWREVLPVWFTSACRSDETEEEAESWLTRLRSLPERERYRQIDQRAWSLRGWLWWFVPDRREWFWWDAVVEGTDAFRVTIEVLDTPVYLDALRWLLRVAGAASIEPVA